MPILIHGRRRTRIELIECAVDIHYLIFWYRRIAKKIPSGCQFDYVSFDVLFSRFCCTRNKSLKTLCHDARFFFGGYSFLLFSWFYTDICKFFFYASKRLVYSRTWSVIITFSFTFFRFVQPLATPNHTHQIKHTLSSAVDNQWTKVTVTATATALYMAADEQIGFSWRFEGDRAFSGIH